MNVTRSDASTSTDDVKGRPLCLFYFTHPFGVLSPEAPRVFDMESAVPPFCWPSASDSYRSSSPTPATPCGGAGGGGVGGGVVPVGSRRAPLDSLSSSLVSSEAWFTSASGSSARDYPIPRRALPYARILPPLRLPSPRDLADYSSDDVWPARTRPTATRFSLPPIELPVPRRLKAPPDSPSSTATAAAGTRDMRTRRPPRGVDKHRRHRHRRARAGDLRRLLARLIRRAIKGVSGGGESSASPSPALQRVLHTIRDAWAEPASLAVRTPTYYRYAVSSKKEGTDTILRSVEGEAMNCMQLQAAHSENVRGDASPGLLRRRYSVPETIMRKYRLAQQRSESEEVASCTRHSTASASASPALEPIYSPNESPHRFFRRDRELMRKSALLRRLWARPAACACCESRSLDGSRSELRRSPVASPPPAPPAWASPKRQRLERRTAAAELSDSTYQSHARGACSCTDALTDSEISEQPTTEPPSAPSPPAAPSSGDRSFSDSDPFSTSLSTAKETVRPPQRKHGEPPVNTDPVRNLDHCIAANSVDCAILSYDRPLTVDTTTSPYELLEIVVTETVNGTPAVPPQPLPIGLGRVIRPPAAPISRDIDIDQYVSNILVESLNSLSDQLECMNASIGNDRKISIVEKEIKVKLQNTGVNTIVHLSPTSNNQIIFGNEELCNEAIDHDECNNPRELVIRDELESNNNPTPTPESPPPPPPPAPVFHATIQHDNVNKAVLQQIQRLFINELDQLDHETVYPAEAISHIQISNVDVYIDKRTGDNRDGESDLIGGVGAGNYFQDAQDAAVVPRFSAFPHTDSMEVNTSSSEDAELGGSDCTSLVDSLDDPNSPRSALRRRTLVRSSIDVLDLLPDHLRIDSPPRDKPEAFFIRIENDRCDPDPDDVKVAEYMPEKIKQRLYRRHRKRELRMECARRGKVKQLKRELEQRRREELVEVERELEKQCLGLVDSLLDEIISKIVQDEFKCMRIKQRNGRLPAAKSEENISRRSRKISHESRRTSLDAITDAFHHRVVKTKASYEGRSSDDRNRELRKTERRQIHGKLVARPSVTSSTRAPRRFYQKSEIHEGDKCIEILEILEYVNGSQSSPETTNSDDTSGNGSKSKKSRIPIPVYERTLRSAKNDHMRLTGGDGGRVTSQSLRENEDPSGDALAELLLEALVDQRRVAAPSEPRSRSNSLRFKGVFDIIPEERSSLSLESSCEDAAPAGPPAQVSRNAGTSPHVIAAAPPALCEQTTMTSPHNKSAATSPLHLPPPPPPPTPPPSPPREGSREAVGRQREVSTIDRGCSPGDTTLIQYNSLRTRKTHGNPRQSLERNESMVQKSEREGTAAAAADRREPCRPPLPRSVSESGARMRPQPQPTGDRVRRAGGAGRVDGDSSDSGDSGGSLLCSLAPRWLSTHARRDRRRTRRIVQPPPSPSPPPPLPPPTATEAQPKGGWSVTVAGSCRAALPHDVEMRLRFPHERGVSSPPPSTAHPPSSRYQECSCVQCASCAARTSRPALPPAPPHPPPGGHHDPTLTLTLKKEAQDSSILASKTMRRSKERLPELETYRASRTKVKSSVKTRRGYSLHCWLPEDEPVPIRGNNGLSVLGCAIIPELKPRVPTMSERDLTRVYTPRHYLRS